MWNQIKMLKHIITCIKYLILPFSLSMLSVCLVNGLMSYPTLEAWGLWKAWDSRGLPFFLSISAAFAERPLHLITSLFAWLLPGPYDTGLIFTGFLLGLSRWILAEIISRQFNLTAFNKNFFIFLIVALPAWQHSGLERFHAAQACVSFFLAAVSSLKMFEMSGNIVWVISGIIASLCGLMTYQSMALVMVFFPFLFVAGRKEDRWFAIISAMVLIGSLIFYILFRLIIIKFFPESHTAQGETKFFEMKCLYLPYIGVFNSGYLSVLSLLIICFYGVISQDRPLSGLKIKFIIPICVLLIAPLTALVFNHYRQYKMVDPGRIMGPIQIFMIMSLLAFRPEKITAPIITNKWINSTAISICILAYIQSGATVLYCIVLQIQFFDQMRLVARDFEPDSKVLILDKTGVIGNVYTIYHQVINNLTVSNDIPGTYKIFRSSDVLNKWAPGSFHPSAMAPVLGTDQKQESFDHLLAVLPTRKLFGYPVTISISELQND